MSNTMFAARLRSSALTTAFKSVAVAFTVSTVTKQRAAARSDEALARTAFASAEAGAAELQRMKDEEKQGATTKGAGAATTARKGAKGTKGTKRATKRASAPANVTSAARP